MDGTTTQRTEHIYDTDNRITEQSWQLGNKTYTQDYTYRSADGALTKVVTEENGTTKDTLNYSYDSIKRLLNRSNSVYTQTYSYKQITADGGYGERSSTLVSKLKYTWPNKSSSDALEFNYTYDANGNITKVTQDGSTLATYTYDGQGQLIKEVTGGKTYNYTYDTAGNILSVSGGSTASYTYDNSQWRDLLTAYNGQTITYDAAGNPTTYYDGTTMTWTQGRRLAEIKNGDTTVASYTYDMSGIRTSKTVGDTTYNYITQNGQVVRQTWGDNTLDIVYDNNNQPYYCIYTPDGGTATTYYYVTNLQGDVVRLVNTSGTTVASYTYNAWGKCTVETNTTQDIANVNPIRYRGYYYDTESGFYYLQSRYYDPEICRFINADAPELSEMTAYSVNDSNLFAYCGNNPVMRGDAEGELWNIVAGALVGGVVNAAIDIITNTVIEKNDDYNWKNALGAFAYGAAIGGLSATGIFSPTMLGAIDGGLSAFVSSAQSVADGEMTVGEAAVTVVTGAAMGAVLGRYTPKTPDIINADTNLVTTIRHYRGTNRSLSNNARQRLIGIGNRALRSTGISFASAGTAKVGEYSARTVYRYYSGVIAKRK